MSRYIRCDRCGAEHKDKTQVSQGVATVSINGVPIRPASLYVNRQLIAERDFCPKCQQAVADAFNEALPRGAA